MSKNKIIFYPKKWGSKRSSHVAYIIPEISGQCQFRYSSDFLPIDKSPCSNEVSRFTFTTRLIHQRPHLHPSLLDRLREIFNKAEFVITHDGVIFCRFPYSISVGSLGESDDDRSRPRAGWS